MRFTSCTLLIASLVAVASAAPKRAKPQDFSQVEKFHLMGHSFSSPLTHENNAAKWSLEGASVPAASHVVLTPAIANRHGFLWHREPLETAHFEVEFDFTVSGPDVTKSDGFAFWYSMDNFDSIFPRDGKMPDSWNLFGYKANFNGVGVFFSNFDKSGRVAPSVSVQVNDGSKEVLRTTVPTDFYRAIKFRNPVEPVKFRFAAGPKGLQGYLQLVPSANSPWMLCFSIDSKLKAGGFLGFTSFTGPAEGAARTDSVMIRSMNVQNLDMHAAGEKLDSMPGSMADVAAEVLSTPAPHDMEGSTDLVLKVTRLLSLHTQRSEASEEAFFKTLNAVQQQVHHAAHVVRELRREVEIHEEASASSGDPTRHVKALMNEVSTLKAQLEKSLQRNQYLARSMSQQMKNKALDEEADHTREVHTLARRAVALEAAVTHHRQRSQTLVVVCLLAVVFLAGSMYRKLQRMEKAHFL